MKADDIEIVYKAIREYGDDFWTKNDEDHGSNIYLFENILTYVNQAGYDLKLIKLE